MDENNNPVLETVGLTKVFRDFWRRSKVCAVDSLDLRLQGGGIFGLLGPNGSGKTTTLKLLLGLLFPSSGEIRVFGSSPRGVEIKQRLGYLSESSYPYQYLTPRETLTFYGKLFGLGSRLLKSRVEELLEMVSISHAADRPVGEFSKGMTRRVGLAQALINDPELILLDEPTSGLDPMGCRQVKEMMLKWAEQGKTIVLSSHLLADVEDVCDKIVILYNGKVRAQGSVTDLLEKHESICLTVPSLPPEKTKELLSEVRRIVGQEPSVAHPHVKLEQFFLEVVEEARRIGADKKG